MLFQFTGVKKGLRSLGAIERSLTGVFSPHMVIQVERFGKGPAALRTTVGLLSCVNFQAGLWICIDLMRIRIRIRIQFF
jgi:hypothetical protein